jgi:hypothetical protein
MTWRYEQKTGRLLHYENDEATAERVAIGYAGAGEGKNNPAMQDVQNVGPLPVGKYTIGEPSDTKTHGPYVLHLTPDPENEMFGRSGFLIHGDSVVQPGTASEGCMIFSRTVRERVWDSGDRQLEVV